MLKGLGTQLYARPSPAARVPGRVIVTSALVSRWCESARRDAPLGTTRCLVKAYRMACHYGDTEEEVGVESWGWGRLRGVEAHAGLWPATTWTQRRWVLRCRGGC